MALSAEEEETLDAIKRWWHETGKMLAAGIAVVVIGWLGWQQWERMQEGSTASASALFDELTALVIVAPGEAVPEDDRQQARSLIDELKQEYSRSSYALYAAMFAARIAVESNELATAEAELQWVLDNQPSGLFSSTEETLINTARLRLGRVILAQGEPDRAMSTIRGAEEGALGAEFAELRGDIFMALGQRAEALDSYQTAASRGMDSPFLDMKINDLAADA